MAHEALSKPGREPDAVELVRGPDRGNAEFLCDACGTLQTRERDLPTGGVICVACADHITAADLVAPATTLERGIALLLDATITVAVGLVLLIPVETVFYIVSAKDEFGSPTEGAERVLGLIVIAASCAYFALGSLLGATPGKRLMGICVVDTTTLRAPRLHIRLVRAVARIVTLPIALVAGLLMRGNDGARFPHDAITGTRVIHRASRGQV